MTRRDLLQIAMLLQRPGAPGNMRMINPALVSVSVTGSAPLIGRTSQLRALAHWSDGSMSDVTTQAVWTSTNPSVLRMA